MQKRPKVLFLSTGNSTRSQMAEGFLRSLAGDQLDVESAGVRSAAPNPEAAQVMREVGIDISRQKSKTVPESLKEHFGYVVTIADTSMERSPIFPSTPHLLKWSAADPADAREASSDRLTAFRRVRDQIRAKVMALVQEITQEQPALLQRKAS